MQSTLAVIQAGRRYGSPERPVVELYWIEQGLTSPPTQYYPGDSFTGQKTELTASKY